MRLHLSCTPYLAGHPEEAPRPSLWGSAWRISGIAFLSDKLSLKGERHSIFVEEDLCGAREE